MSGVVYRGAEPPGPGLQLVATVTVGSNNWSNDLTLNLRGANAGRLLGQYGGTHNCVFNTAVLR